MREKDSENKKFLKIGLKSWWKTICAKCNKNCSKSNPNTSSCL